MDALDNDDDNDGIPDNIDNDDDNDGIPDDQEAIALTQVGYQNVTEMRLFYKSQDNRLNIF